ncbi:MAG: NAD(P)/FAD-dependent oxidoreductase [Synergistales bacterium]
MSGVFDLVVLGGGPGGYRAAELAAKSGMKVALVEKDRLGGMCLNRGCIPTKAYYARIVGGHGDVESLWEGKEEIVSRLREGLATLMRMTGVETFRGTGRIVGTGEVKKLEVSLENGSVQEIEGRNLLIATGSRSLPLEIEGAGLPGVITGDWAVASPDLWKSPERESFSSVALVGAGVIAVELAAIFRKMGKEVTILKHSDELLRRADKDIKKKLAQNFRKKKINMVDFFRPERISREGSGIRVFGSTPNGPREVECDRLIVASSMVPVLEGFGLENTSIQADPRKGIPVDEGMRTCEPGIFAIGDVTGGMMLAHLAEYQALAAVEAMRGRTVALPGESVPWCVFSDPEIAAVGLSEQEAEKRGLPFVVGRAYFLGNGMALALGQVDGFVKVVAGRDGKLLGVHMVGPETASMISEAALAIRNGLSVRDVAYTVHPHPTLSECFKDALFRTLEELEKE